MLVCQCNIIAEKQVRQVIRDLLSEDPWTLLVPAKVYRALEKRCKCSGCVPNVVDIITKVTEEYHLEIADKQAEPETPPARPSVLRHKRRVGGRYERRSAGHRAA
jgi:bacterioferritin-associated ferredoxin